MQKYRRGGMEKEWLRYGAQRIRKGDTANEQRGEISLRALLMRCWPSATSGKGLREASGFL